MTVTIEPRRFAGRLRVPPSKSHTIRRLLLAAFSDGVSVIERPLDALDARSCLAVCRRLGAGVSEVVDMRGKASSWTVRGILSPPRRASYLDADGGSTEPLTLDVGNSGTTLFLFLAMAALGRRPVTFTGDAQIARRSAGSLLDALRGLGATVEAGEDGCVPITVRGPWKGGCVSIECPTSQYLSALLLAAPLAPFGTATEIHVPLLNERPYVEMTLAYLAAQRVKHEADESFTRFVLAGGGRYAPVNGPVCGDFSSAAYPALAAAVSGGAVTIAGLDPADTQGDKAFLGILQQMGVRVRWLGDRERGFAVRVEAGGRVLRGGVFDLNATPDLLPALAVLAAYADGDTHLVNVAHARLKETDRIAVMAEELGRLGVVCEELPDGLVIRGLGASGIAGGIADGHGDHRVVMALAAGALGARAPVTVLGAEAADITYPGFIEFLCNNAP